MYRISLYMIFHNRCLVSNSVVHSQRERTPWCVISVASKSYFRQREVKSNNCAYCKLHKIVCLPSLPHTYSAVSAVSTDYGVSDLREQILNAAL